MKSAEWEAHDDVSIPVPLGSQIAFLVIPMADEVRLGGEFTPTLTVDLPENVVPDTQVLAVREGGVTAVGEPVTFFAVAPGIVTFTVSEPEHDIHTEQTFEIVSTWPAPVRRGICASFRRTSKSWR